MATGTAFTVMVVLQVAVLPQSSVAVQVTIWVPALKITPLRDDPVLGLTPASVV